MSKVKEKERILKTAREETEVTYMEIPIRLSADFSIKIFQARKEWDTVKLSKEKKMTKILYPAKLSFRAEGRIKTLPNKQKLREFITIVSALQEMLVGVFEWK